MEDVLLTSVTQKNVPSAVVTTALGTFFCVTDVSAMNEQWFNKSCFYPHNLHKYVINGIGSRLPDWLSVGCVAASKRQSNQFIFILPISYTKDLSFSV